MPLSSDSDRQSTHSDLAEYTQVVDQVGRGLGGSAGSEGSGGSRRRRGAANANAKACVDVAMKKRACMQPHRPKALRPRLFGLQTQPSEHPLSCPKTSCPRRRKAAPETPGSSYGRASVSTRAEEWGGGVKATAAGNDHPTGACTPKAPHTRGSVRKPHCGSAPVAQSHLEETRCLPTL